ncbi:MAG: DUF1566 domain-containing protein [Myxococcales bacterium]
MPRVAKHLASAAAVLGLLILAAPEATAAPAKVGDRLSVEWKGDWFAAQVLAVDGDKVRVRYDGYDESWDEWVGPERYKAPATAAGPGTKAEPREAAKEASGRFTAQGDTVLDTKTKLLWERDGADKKLTLKDAVAACKAKKLAGKKGWRLPSNDELETLVLNKFSATKPPAGPVFDEAAFPGMKRDYYWSASEFTDGSGQASVGFKDGIGLSDSDPASTNYARCVWTATPPKARQYEVLHFK